VILMVMDARNGAVSPVTGSQDARMGSAPMTSLLEILKKANARILVRLKIPILAVRQRMERVVFAYVQISMGMDAWSGLA
jgi:hypothetical protein